MVHTLQLTTKLQPNTTTWKTYINTKYKYSIKYPSNFEGSDKTGNAISNDFGAPSEGSSFPSLYISVIPDPSKNVPTSSIYNYLLPSFIDSFSSLAPGEIKPEQSGTGNYQEYFTFKKLMDTVTNNQSATTIENNKVWEGDQGLIDRRVFIKKGSDYYQLGAYYKTSEELANFETFLDSFKFTQ
jgi:hypothetical protein